MSGDAPPPDSPKFLKRKTAISEVAKKVCHSFSSCLFPIYKIEDAFQFNSKSIEIDKMLTRYFKTIEDFKQNNGMKGNEVANRCKRAASFIVVNSDFKNLEKLFIIRDLPRSDYKDMFLAHFIYSVCCALLEIDRTNIPPEVEGNFMHNLLKEQGRASFGWLVLAMRSFADAYGDKPVE